MEQNILPVILGPTEHAYSYAVDFDKQFGMECLIVAQDYLKMTKYSSLFKRYEVCPNIYEDESFLNSLIEVASKHPKQTLILLPTSDKYLSLVVKYQDELKKYYKLNVPTTDQFNKLFYKRNFYETCKAFNVDIPETYVHHFGDSSFNESIQFPVILKVDDSSTYTESFEGKQKIYYLNSYDEINETIQLIYTQSNYKGALIIQEYIEGSDTTLYDIVYYANQSKKAQFISFAQVLLQDPELISVGNYLAMISRYNKTVMDQAKSLMEGIGYQGFANFDLKYDKKDGKYKFFEANLRIGRGSSYINSSKRSMSQLLIDDLIEEKSNKLYYMNNKVLFSFIPIPLLKKYINENSLHLEVNELSKQKAIYRPLKYYNEKSLKHKVYSTYRLYVYYKKLKKSAWQKEIYGNDDAM